MAGTVSVATNWVTVASDVAAPGSNTFNPGGMWLEAGALMFTRATIEMRSRTGNIEVIGAIQWANNYTSPDATPTLLGSAWLGANGIQNPSAMTDVTATARARQWARIGWVTRNAAATTGTGTAEVRAKFDLNVRSLNHTDVDWDTVYAHSTTATFLPVSGWEEAIGFPLIRGVAELRNPGPNLEVVLAVQTANDPDSPDAPVPIGSALSAGVNYPTVFTSVTLADKQLIRYGYNVRLTAAGNTACGRIASMFQSATT